MYRGELTGKALIEQISRLKKAFPSLPINFYDVLIERVKTNKFIDERLKDAVDNLIDTCIYPVPTIANLISYDKKIQLYEYEEVRDMASEHGKYIWDCYKLVDVDQKYNYYAHIDDIRRYKLTIVKK